MQSELVLMDKLADVLLTLAHRFKVNHCNCYLKWIDCADGEEEPLQRRPPTM